MEKHRIDQLLVERGLARDAELAQRLVMEGRVRLNGEIVRQASRRVPLMAHLEVEQSPPYVSRGGEKLASALSAFPVVVAGQVCADIGASTGGFTDCLLQHGAARVYAIDVGQGILAWKLRQDEHVIVMENTNARYLTRLPEPVSLVTIDASFISLKVLLPVVKAWSTASWPDAVRAHHQTNLFDVIALIKPQFEASRSAAARSRGVIREPAIHRQVLHAVLEYAINQDYDLRGLIRSPLYGPKGNQEFLAWFGYPGSQSLALEAAIEIALTQP